MFLCVGSNKIVADSLGCITGELLYRYYNINNIVIGNSKNATINCSIPKFKEEQLNITFDCGVDDFFINANRKLHQQLLKYKIPHDYTERPGRHLHPYWKNSIRYHLIYFHNIFSK